MKVILLKDIGGIGRHGEIKDLADGYVFNKLIPAGLVQQATPDKVAAHAAQMKKDSEARAKEQQALIASIQSLEGAHIEVSARATEKGGLFKSIGVADIQKAIREQKHIEIPTEAIALEKPIKEVGEHAIELKTPDAKARLVFAVKKNA